MSEAQAGPRRRLVRAGLLAGIAISLLGLFAVLRVGPFAASPGEGAPAARTRDVTIRVTDAEGRRLGSAVSVFTLRPREGAAVAERWKPETGILQVPVDQAPSSLVVGARGYRLAEIERVEASQTVRLRRGLRVRVSLRNAPDVLDPRHVRFLLRIRPLDAGSGDEDAGLGAAVIVDLMDNLGRPGSGPKDLPRGEFGYPVSRVQAHAGILVPVPGRYEVRWGLMDTRARTWFSLGVPCSRRVTVRDVEGLQTFTLGVTEGDLQQTLEGLASSIKRIGED